MRSEGLSLHSFLISSLPFPEWEESTWVDVQFGYTYAWGFKE